MFSMISPEIESNPEIKSVYRVMLSMINLGRKKKHNYLLNSILYFDIWIYRSIHLYIAMCCHLHSMYVTHLFEQRRMKVPSVMFLELLRHRKCDKLAFEGQYVCL